MTVLERYRRWQRTRRQLRDAGVLIREARRGLRRYSHRLTDQATVLVREALDAVTALVADAAREPDQLARGLNELDRAIDDYMPFARKSTAREYVESIAVAVLIALFLRAFVVEAFKIPSGSMIPTLEVGDHIFVNKFIYGIRVPFTNIKFGQQYRKPKRGEVIVFVYPREPEKDFIKRIVAVEGDAVELRGNNVYVNGVPIPYQPLDGECRYWDLSEVSQEWHEVSCQRRRETVDGTSYTVVFDHNRIPKDWPPVKVAPGTVFVMGDNRDNSHDSRYWGTVPFDNIKGKAMLVWWSAGQPEGWIRLRRLFHLIR